eukprot:TRINITY_DN2361_c0_g2_i2.p1 TRINITY_DN2361_c0_g2~~TRINITY_DN2361_c0_g2_i2.p1  ORF type:complete len:894 (+),score=239.19 TRINITY_DN2361_c0_g2_i2:40-2682(+)
MNGTDSPYPEDLDAPTPDPEELTGFHIRLPECTANVTIPEESIPWFVSVCVANHYDVLRRIWGLKTRRDRLREQRDFEARIAKNSRREERARKKVDKEQLKEFTLLLAEHKKEFRELESARKKEERRLAKEEAKRKRQEEKEERKRQREKERRKLERKKQREREKRRSKGERNVEDEEEDEEAPPEEEEEEEDEPEEPEEDEELEAEEDGEGAAIEEEEGVEEEDEHSEEEHEEEDGNADNIQGDKSEDESRGDVQLEGDEEAEESVRRIKRGDFDVNSKFTLWRDAVGDDGEVRFLLMTMEDARAERERQRQEEAELVKRQREESEMDDETEPKEEDDEPAHHVEEEENAEEAEGEATDVDTGEAVIDLLTLAVSQESTEAAALLLYRGANTGILEEFLEELTQPGDTTMLENFISAVNHAKKEHGFLLSMSMSWFFQSVALTTDPAASEKLLDRLLDAGIRPLCPLDTDPCALHTAREIPLFCKMLLKLEPDAMLVKQPVVLTEDGEPEEEPEAEPQDDPEPEEGEDSPVRPPRRKKTTFQVPFFLSGALRNKPEKVDVASWELERPNSRDVVCGTIPQPTMPWKELKIYWSDVMLLLLVLQKNNAKFLELLKRKAAVAREYGKPPGTWIALYLNAAILAEEQLEAVISENPAVFKYAGGVQLDEFLQQQWHLLSPAKQQLITHYFYQDLLQAKATPRNKATKGHGTMDQMFEKIAGNAQTVQKLYDSAVELLSCTTPQEHDAKKLQDLVKDHNLNLFTPFYLEKAVRAKNLAMVELFLDSGCSPEISPDAYHRPQGLLRYAIEQRDIPLILLLVRRGADLREVWDGGKTTPMKFMETRYTAEQLAAVLQHWREVEGRRMASSDTRFGMLRRQVAVRA